MTDQTPMLEKTGVRLLLLTLVVIAALAAYFAIDVLLLAFLGILFAVFLVKVSELVGRFIPLAYHWNLGIVVTLLLTLSIGLCTLFGVSIESRLDETTKKVEDSSEKLKHWLDKRPFAMSTIKSIPFVGSLVEDQLSVNSGVTTDKKGQRDSQDPPDKSSNTPDSSPSRQNSNDTENNAPDSQDSSGSQNSGSQNSDEASSEKSTSKMAQSDQSGASGKQADKSSQSKSESSSASSLAGRAFKVATDILKTTFGIVTNLAVIFFVGVFIAANPTLYRDGFARLFAIDKRSRVVEVMDKMGDALFHWLNGRFLAMLVTGVGTGIALWLLGVPLAFTVGAITALLTFIPNIGGIIALLLAMLMALSQGPMTVLWVVILYGVLQLIESNIMTPLVQQQQTSIPPAMLITFQIFMGVLIGFLGILVSTPLLAATLVLVNEVWVKDTLGDRAQQGEEIPGIDGSQQKGKS